MTTLRDDGNMEIDDPEVAACFIGQRDYATYSIAMVGADAWIEGEL